jgi:hypothetical protein
MGSSSNNLIGIGGPVRPNLLSTYNPNQINQFNQITINKSSSSSDLLNLPQINTKLKSFKL